MIGQAVYNFITDQYHILGGIRTESDVYEIFRHRVLLEWKNIVRLRTEVLGLVPETSTIIFEGMVAAIVERESGGEFG